MIQLCSRRIQGALLLTMFTVSPAFASPPDLSASGPSCSQGTAVPVDQCKGTCSSRNNDNQQQQIRLNVMLAEVIKHRDVTTRIQAMLEGADPLHPADRFAAFAGLAKDEKDFWDFIEGLKNEHDLKVLALPRIACLCGRQASCFSGSEQAVPVPAGEAQVGVQFEEFGVRLNLRPTILDKDRIRLEIESEISELDPESSTTIGDVTVPGRRTQRMRACMKTKIGQTCVLGGLSRHVVKSSSETVTELVVLVTPEPPEPVDCAQEFPDTDDVAIVLAFKAANLQPDHPAVQAAIKLARMKSRIHKKQ